MNPPNRKSPPETKGVSQFGRPVAGARPFKPAVVQSKSASAAQPVKRPVAPPVYSPQPKPKVMQTKSSGARQSQPSDARRQPFAPPAKRYGPKVLQLKQTPSAEAKARPAPSAPKQGVVPLNARSPQRHAPARQVIQRAASSSAAADYRDDPEYGAGKGWPAGKADRPYNDFPEAKYPGIKNCCLRGNFSGEQRQALITYNKLKNGGQLKSDSGDDPHQDLTEGTGKATSVEVDHIIPKVMGGSNHFLNARLISWELNNKVERIKDTSALVIAKK
jgi:hypothetical protein